MKRKSVFLSEAKNLAMILMACDKDDIICWFYGDGETLHFVQGDNTGALNSTFP